jgi:hypothetical protein
LGNPLRADQKLRVISLRESQSWARKHVFYIKVHLGGFFASGAWFFASKDGLPVGTGKSFDEAIEMLARKGQP